MHVVHDCKHLGGVVQSNLSNREFVSKRSPIAIAAYVPIAGRALGTAYVYIQVKLFLMDSLFESSLLHLSHIHVLKSRLLKALNVILLPVQWPGRERPCK